MSTLHRQGGILLFNYTLLTYLTSSRIALKFAGGSRPDIQPRPRSAAVPPQGKAAEMPEAGEEALHLK